MQHGFSGEMITFAPALIQALAAHGSNAVYADMGGSSGGIPSIVVENIFQIEGNATQETVEALAAYGDSLKSIIKEAIEEIESDTVRMAYR